MVTRPYSPGIKSKRRRRTISEYGRELREKQKLKAWYNLEEKQFRKYIKEVLEKRGKVPTRIASRSVAGGEDTSALLVKKLESRLDNVVFRMGFTPSRRQAHQIINHNHFLVNGKMVNIPSFQTKKGDKISLNPRSRKKIIFQNLPTVLKKYKPPSWIKVNIEKLEGEIISEPSSEEIIPPAEISAIFEFYSR